MTPRPARVLPCVAMPVLLLALLPSCAAPPAASSLPWVPLFDGKTSAGWESAGLGDEESFVVGNGVLHLRAREGVGGVRWTGTWGEVAPPSREGYELRLEAMREYGTDFFCGLTFPVGGDGDLSLICGGWGGALVGLSSLDGRDASENETTLYRHFERGRWYAVRVRVTRERIECFLDGERVIAVSRTEHTEYAVRPEMLPFLPLGLATYETRGAFRNIAIRRLE